MADFSFPTLPAVTPPPQTSLGDMLNIARGAQAYQQAQQVNPLELQAKQMAVQQAQQINPLALQQQQAQTTGAQQTAELGGINLDVAKQKNQERLALQEATTRGDFLGSDGKLDLNKFNATAPKIAPLTWAEQGQTLSTLAKAQTDASSAKQNLTTEQRQMISQRFSILGRLGVQDKNQYIKEMDVMKQENPDNPDLIKLLDSYKTIWQNTMQSGPDLPSKAISGAQTLLTPAQQQTAFAPQAGTLSTGEQIFPTVTTPSVGGMLPRIQMGAQPLTDVGLPPTTEVIDPVTGQKRLLGPASQRGGAQLTTGLGPAQTSLLSAGASTMATDLSATIKDAADAPSRVAIFQNIKKFAPDSFTGVGGQRKELAAGILNAVGISAYEAEKVSTEELAKNSALLALAGGNTDAARALAEVATPNKKLNEKAILAIADQMIGIENMKVAKANYLTPAQNDATQYGQRKLQFDQIADPRIFQEMTAQDVGKLKASMSAAEQAELTRKIRLARQMGIIK